MGTKSVLGRGGLIQGSVSSGAVSLSLCKNSVICGLARLHARSSQCEGSALCGVRRNGEGIWKLHAPSTLAANEWMTLSGGHGRELTDSMIFSRLLSFDT